MSSSRASNPTTNCFEDTNELTKLNKLKRSLNRKVGELKTVVEGQRLNDDVDHEQTIDYKKLTILEAYLEAFNGKVTEFNQRSHDDRVNQLDDITWFANEITTLTEQTLEQSGQILNTPRNAQRKWGDRAIQATIYGTAGIFAVTQTFGMGAAALLGSKQVAGQARHHAGTTSVHAESFSLLVEMKDTAEKINKNIATRVSLLQAERRAGAQI